MHRIATFQARGLLVASLLIAAGVVPVVSAATSSTAQAAEVTKASWYGPGFHGKRTASGKVFDMHRLTAAHRTLRLGSRVKVTALRTGRSVLVDITDRGPYVAGRGIDLSYAAARRLGIVDTGVVSVRIDLVGRSQRAASPPRAKPAVAMLAPGHAPILLASSSHAPSWLPRAISE